MKKHLAGVLAAALLLGCVTGCSGGRAGAPTSPGDPFSEVVNDGGAKDAVSLDVTYSNEECGFSFMYPASWGPYDHEGRAEFLDERSVVYISDTGRWEASATFRVDRYEPDDVINVSKDEFNRHFSSMFEDYNLIEFSDDYLGGVPARYVVASFRDENGIFVGGQCYFVNGPYMYVINYRCFQEDYELFEPVFDAMLGSFEVTKPRASDVLSAGNDAAPKPAVRPPADWYALDTIFYGDVNIVYVLGSTFQDVEAELGHPNNSAGTSGDDYLSYDGITFCGDGRTAVVCAVYADPAYLTARGGGLGKDRNEIVSALGKPDDEFYDRGDQLYAVIYRYYSDWGYDTIVRFSFADAGGYAGSLVEVQVVADLDYGSGNQNDWGGNSEEYIDGIAEWVEHPSGTTDSWSTTINGVLRNISGEEISIAIIQFRVYDASGNQVDSATDTIDHWGPGNTWKFSAISFSGNASRFELAEITYF